ARLGLARDRRRARDARQPLLLPGDRAGDVHAAPGGACDRGWLTASRAASAPRGRRGARRLGRLPLRRPAADRPRTARRLGAAALGTPRPQATRLGVTRPGARQTDVSGLDRGEVAKYG